MECISPLLVDLAFPTQWGQLVRTDVPRESDGDTFNSLWKNTVDMWSGGSTPQCKFASVIAASHAFNSLFYSDTFLEPLLKILLPFTIAMKDKT